MRRPAVARRRPPPLPPRAPRQPRRRHRQRAAPSRGASRSPAPRRPSPPPRTSSLTGQVSSVGILDVSTSSTPAYTVVISVDATQARLFDGASAQIVISLGGNEETLTVPTSAVHVDGTTVTVTVLRDGAPVDVEVQTGAVGSELTE